MEAVLYLALVSGVLAAIIGVAINLSNIKVRAIAQGEVDYSLAFADDQLNREIMQAGGIDFNASLLDNDQGSLALTGPAAGAAETRVYLDKPAGRLKISSASGVDNLTTGLVEVTAFRLSRLADNTVAVKLSVRARVPVSSGPYFQSAGTLDQIYQRRADCRPGTCL